MWYHSVLWTSGYGSLALMCVCCWVASSGGGLHVVDEIGFWRLAFKFVYFVVWNSPPPKLNVLAVDND